MNGTTLNDMHAETKQVHLDGTPSELKETETKAVGRFDESMDVTDVLQSAGYKVAFVLNPKNMSTEKIYKLVTDSLGFRLEVSIIIDTEMTGRGRHKTYEPEGGKVPPDAPHEIWLNSNLAGAELAEVIAHEVYHLFYSVRHLIAVDEETEAEVFGQLVSHLHLLHAKLKP
jgi:hypothetical protein